MRRFIDSSKHAIQRVNPKIAAGVGGALVVVLGVWLAFGRRPSKPEGPTKQIETGMGQPAPGTHAVQPAVANLADEQLPGASSGGSHRATQFAQSESPAATLQPATNPYLPSTSDPAGGYAVTRSERSQYSPTGSQFGQTSEQSPATSVPTDPTARSTTETPPANIYREYPAAANDSLSPATIPTTQPPLSQSPYAATVRGAEFGNSTPSPEPPTTAPPASDLPPIVDASTAYANRYQRGSSGFGQPANTPPSQPASTPPPISSPTTPDLSTSPYTTSQTPRPIATGGSGLLSSSGLNSFRTSPLPTADSGKRLAAPTPGERQFEGPQQPSIALEKISPSEIQVGKPATFELYVRNVGKVAASNVVVSDHVPAGTQLIDVRPQPQQGSDGSLVWSLGTMQPGDETQITLQVMPQTEGEIGSTAHVAFAAAATSRSICTRPQLAIEHTAPPKVLIGEGLTVGITVSNPGTGPATGVIIEEDVPEGLSHVAGSQLEYEVGVLRPGESKRLELSLRAERAGIVQNMIRVRGDANLAGKHAVQIEVVAPQLQVAIEGPKVRFLERQATHTLQVANPGTAAARDVELMAQLPRGIKFVSADSQGQYDPSQHTVFWSLAELPPGGKGSAKLTTIPIEPGDQPLRIEGHAALGISAKDEQTVHVEQAAELVHTVKDLDEVIEVGSETTYEIHVLNKGTKAATNLRIAALMPNGMSAMSGEGPTRAGGDATQVIFEPLARLNPREEIIYKVQVQARQPGDHIVRVQLSSDEWPTPVTREESTRVYQDR